MSPERFPITLIIVSDFEPGAKTWHDEDRALQCYLRDPNGTPSEVIVAAYAGYETTPRPDWSFYDVPVRTVFVNSERSATIKNAAVDHSCFALIALIEADCLAEPGWLSALYRAFQRNPEIDAVSGRTIYEPTSSLRRVASLYDRCFIEERNLDGSAKHVSNNGALSTAKFLQRFPFVDVENPFVSGEQRVRDASAQGACFEFTPDAIQYHAYGGWPFIRDVRRNKGHQFRYLARQKHEGDRGPGERLGWRIRMVARHFRKDYQSMRRSFSDYCHSRDLFLAILFPLLVRHWEWQGAAMADRGLEAVENTAYR